MFLKTGGAMIYLCYFLIGFLVVRLLVAFVNYLSFHYLPKDVSLKFEPKVSVLIPARNEEDTIGILLEQLSKIDYTNLEIIVYNDHSTDATASILITRAAKNPAMKILKGGELPQGWLGKNNACHQLSLAATGELLLFLDADVQVKPDLLKRSVYHLQKHQLDLLSIFPKQVMNTLGEQVSVPLMNWILLSLLPLVLISKSKSRHISAANGQFMLFNAATYNATKPHEKYKFHKVEDIAIIKDFKQNGFACDTRLGDNDISCRMYTGLHEAVDGFTKNIFEFFGNSVLATVLFWMLTTSAPFLIYFNMGFWWFIAYISGVLSIRIFVSLASKQSVFKNLLFAVPQYVVFLLIIIKGLINKKQQQLVWKGRNIFQK